MALESPPARPLTRPGFLIGERMTNVVRLEPVEVGEGFRFDPDELLESNKGQGWTTLALLGEIDGEIVVCGSANAGETLILLEKAKLQIIGER
jgi:hypothetical protein